MFKCFLFSVNWLFYCYCLVLDFNVVCKVCLFDYPQAIGTLEHLAMPQNGINHPGINALAEAIAANPKLKHLNLNDNTFTVKGAEAIARVFIVLSFSHIFNIINYGRCINNLFLGN